MSFEDANTSLYINQMIKTVQGEGLHTGKPSLLVRVSKCNIRCAYCDTPYSWTHLANLPGNTIVNEQTSSLWFDDINKLSNGYKISNLLLTGGEPFLYRNNKYFWQLLSKPFESIEIETNGTLLDEETIDKIQFVQADVTLNISPKLNKDYYLDKSLYDRMISNIKSIVRSRRFFQKYVLKFVYSDNDRTSIENFIKEINIPKNRVLLMPLTPTYTKFSKESFLEEFNKSSLSTVKYCLESGYRFSPRLHIYLFLDDKTEKIL